MLCTGIGIVFFNAVVVVLTFLFIPNHIYLSINAVLLCQLWPSPTDEEKKTNFTWSICAMIEREMSIQHEPSMHLPTKWNARNLILHTRFVYTFIFHLNIYIRKPRHTECVVLYLLYHRKKKYLWPVHKLNWAVCVCTDNVEYADDTLAIDW